MSKPHRTQAVKPAAEALRESADASQEEAADRAAVNHEVQAELQKAHEVRPELPLPQDLESKRPEAQDDLRKQMEGEAANSAPGEKKPTEAVKVTADDTKDHSESTPKANVPSESAADAVELIGDGPWTFIKNQLIETVILPGGREFTFPKTKIVTADKELAKGLKAVAARHNIIVTE